MDMVIKGIDELEKRYGGGEASKTKKLPVGSTTLGSKQGVMRHYHPWRLYGDDVGVSDGCDDGSDFGDGDGYCGVGDGDGVGVGRKR